jgi:molecular chaperone DnaK (HSP70)/Tfp pilus assembly protein PilF
VEELEQFIPRVAEIDSVKTPLRVLGIDLGTTNSTVAEIIWNPGESLPERVHCLEINQPTRDGTYTNHLVPSVVAIHAGKVMVGEGAKRLRANTAKYKLQQNRDLFCECKNDIGTSITYNKAPQGLRSPADIGGRVLGFLYESALADGGDQVDRVAVTVPASFQAAQRQDTLRAAEYAGLRLSGGDLLDEPVAAFLDYLFSRGADLLPQLSTRRHLVVFDFGGGTCDVAVFSLGLLDEDRRLGVSPLAVSRYHRLGGGDIDRAVFHQVLLPQILAQNGLSDFDFDYRAKKYYLEPSFLGIAEALKISLCKEISRLIAFEKYENADKSRVVVRYPGVHSCEFEGREIKEIGLQLPELNAEQFENVIAPFIDSDLLYPRETEYCWTCSIFAPLSDALATSGLKADQVDYFLLVGGSSLIPQVSKAVSDYFPKARMLTYPDLESVQLAVARGAAYHALALTFLGRGLVQPVSHERISIRTSSGLHELVPKGALLPYPADGGYARTCSLAVPQSSLFEPIDLRVEIVAGAGANERNLFSKNWRLDGPVNQGETLCLEYRYDENQVFDLRLFLADRGREGCFPATLENPLTNVVNPQSKRLKIQEIEQKLFANEIKPAQVPRTLISLAQDYAELGQHEKAVHYLKTVLRSKGPDAEVLNKLALYSGERGDWRGEEKFYREAAEVCSWNGAWFNLALSQRRRGLYAEAVKSLDKALEREREAPYLVLRAMLAENQQQPRDRDRYLAEAMDAFDHVSLLNEWQLQWYLKAAHLAGDAEKIAQIQAETRKRGQPSVLAELEGQLPIIKPALAVRDDP